MPISFHAPSTSLFGAGCRHHLPEQVRILGASKVLIVSDDYLRRSGMLDEFIRELGGSRIESTLFTGVQPDPTTQNVQDGLAVLQSSGADAIVAIGGGSVIDAAKVIGFRNPLRTLPLIVIPTTAGTGSEATKAAVITDTERQVKMLILDPKLMPRTAIVDFELTLSMPASLTAHVGVDTLTHGLEAYVSRKANGMTDPLARSCMELTSRHLLTAWNELENRVAREAMSLAAFQGGMAFTNSSVCLVHGMSRPIGALFHVPHGLSNAVLLPTITKFSLAGAPERYDEVARLMGMSSLVDGLETLNKKLQIGRLRDCVGVNQTTFESSLEKMAGDALASGSPQNNPVIPTAAEIVELYREAW